MKVEELATGMRHAGQFERLAPKQPLVTGEVIDHQGPCPVAQEIRRVHAAPASLIVEDDDRRIITQRIAAVGPEISVFCFPFPGVQLANRGLIGMQHQALAQPVGEAVAERFERDADATYPVGQRRTSQRHPGTSRLLFQTIERQVVGVLADHDPGQQGRCGQAAIDHRRFGHCRCHGCAGSAGVFGVNVAIDEELRGNDIELLGDVFADQYQRLATFTAGAHLRLVPVLDTWQVCGQGLTARAFALGLLGWRLMRPHFGRFALFGQARFAGGQIRSQGFIEEIAFSNAEGFALDAEFHPPQIRQFEGELLDFDVAPVNRGGAGACFFEQATDPLLHPRQQFWRGVKSGKFGGEVHDGLYQTDGYERRQVTVFA